MLFPEVLSRIFIAPFSNVNIFQVHCLWQTSGDFWQSQWDRVRNFFNNDDDLIGLWGTFLLTFIVYWSVGLCYLFVDLTGKPSFLLRYRIQDNEKYPIPLSQGLKVVNKVIVNQLIFGIPVYILVYKLMKWRYSNVDHNLPAFYWMIFHIGIFILVEEVFFYYSHRLLHHPRIYKYIHKQHHEWTSTIAIAALYCHPVEHILCNLLPAAAGPFIVAPHQATVWLWYAMALLSTMNAHSGYHFPFFISNETHNFHHMKSNEVFGVMGLLDRLHGTDSTFRKSKQYRRHFLSFSLVPLKKLYPDDSKEK